VYSAGDERVDWEGGEGRRRGGGMGEAFVAWGHSL